MPPHHHVEHYDVNLDEVSLRSDIFPVSNNSQMRRSKLEITSLKASDVLNVLNGTSISAAA